MDKEILTKYLEKFKGPKECYKHSCKVTMEALEQIEAHVKCIQNIFQDPNYMPALYMLGICTFISVTAEGEDVIKAEFGVTKDGKDISTPTESAG